MIVETNMLNNSKGGRSPRRIILAAFLLSMLVLLLMSSAASASVPANECTLCHGTKVSDFDIPLMTRGAQCAICHDGASHALWKDPVTGRSKYAVYVPGIGYFRTSTSYNEPAASLHTYHSGNNSYSARTDCNMCHGVASCTSCHLSTSHSSHSTSAFVPPGVNSANGSVFDTVTTSCALSNCHQTLPAVVKTNLDGSQLCVNCHPRFNATAKDSTGHDPVLTETKHDATLPNTLNVASLPVQVDCSGCHAYNLVTEHSNKNRDCATCHNNPNLPSVQTVVKAANNNPVNRACDKCHFNIAVIPAQTEHTLFHIASESNNLKIDGGPHTNCNTCHARTTPLSVSVSVYETVYQKTLAELANMIPKNYSCLDCHTGNTNPKIPLHKAEYNGQATNLLDVHADCSYCHTTGSDYAAKVDSIAAALKADPAGSYSCTDCHTNLANSHNAYYEFGIETINLSTTKYHQSCGVCHGNLKVSGVITLLKGSQEPYNCNQCHNGAAAKPAVHTTASSQAIIGYHPAAADSTRCDKCHGEANFTKINILTWPASYECTNCHNGTIAKTALHQAKDLNGVQYATTGLHPTCATCHDSSDPVVQSVITAQKGTSDAYLCADCHTGSLAAKHNANWTDGTAYETTAFHTDCAQCHSNANTAVIDKIHSLKTGLQAGTISTYGCADCHGNVVPQAKHTAKLTATELASQETTQYHAKLGANPGDSCFACHNNAQVASDLDLAMAEVKSGGGYLCTDCHKNADTAPYRPNHLAILGTEQLNTVNEHPACTTCHTTSVDDKITTLKGRTDYSCEDCHTNLVANHKSTTNLADVAFVNCSWCHSSSDPAYADNNLIGVHVKPNITLSKTYTCNVCHSATSPVKDQIAGKLTGCADCHNGTAAPVKHPDSQYYPRHIVNPFPSFMAEYSPNCATCHKDSSLISLHSRYYVGCSTCHTMNAYKPAVVSLNPDCSGCHTSTVNSALDMAESHKPFHNANTALYPATSTCLDCHAKDTTVDGQSLLAVHKKNADSSVTCYTCHGDTARQAVKDAIAANNVSCQTCHGDAGHDHPVAANSYMADAPVACGQCHSTNTTDKGAELSAVHQQAADRGLISNYSCATCHNTNFEGADKVIVKDGNLDMRKNETTPIYCIDCHNGTQADALGEKYPAHDGNHINSAQYGIYQGTYNGQAFDDSGVDCSKCHASLDTKTIHDPAVHPNVNCNSCHQSNNTAVQAVIAGAWSRVTDKTTYTCSSCHNTLPYKHQPEHLASGSENVTCNTCHDGINAPGSFNAPSGTNISVFTAHITNGTTDCNKCHTSANPTVSQFISAGIGIANSAYTCSACHDAITPKHVKQHSVTSYLSTGNANCSGCHNADVSVLHSATTKATLNCDTCHGSDPALPNTKATILANLSTKTAPPGFTCESCHPNAASGHSHRVAANGYGLSPNVDCSKCHSTDTDGSAELYTVHQNAANAGKITNFSCSTCHNSTFEGAGKPIVQDKVLDMKQNGTTVIYCTTCHNGTLADALGEKYPAHDGNHINSTQYGTYQGTYNGQAFDDSGVDCSKCHASLETKSIHDPAVHPNVNCNSCHQSTNTAVQAVIAGAWSRTATKASYTCASCHNTLPYKHQPEHIATSPDYATLDCSGCHSTTSWNNANAKLTDVHSNDCNLCHTSTNGVVNNCIAGKQGQPNSVYACEGCHTTGGAQTKEIVHKPEHLAQHSATNIECSSCHNFAAGAGVPTDISSTNIHKNGCSTCHGGATTTVAQQKAKLFIAGAKGQSNPVYKCEDCHVAIHLGWESKHQPMFPANPNLDCTSCHNNFLPQEHVKYFGTGASLGYTVFRATSSTGPWTSIGTTTATAFADTGLTANTTYYYKVQAYDGKPNYSPDSNIVNTKTLSNTEIVITVNPDAANYATGNNGDSSADPSSTTNVLTILTDNSNSTYSATQENGSSDRYVIVKLNKDAANYSKIELKMSVRYYNGTSLQIYPYSSDTAINTAAFADGLSRSSSSSYITETIDVTMAAKTMSGFGWMKFRIKPDPNRSASAYIANVQFVLTQNPLSGGTVTNSPGTVVSNLNDTVVPTAPTGLQGSTSYYDRIDLTWTASTDSGAVIGEANTCGLCHSSSAPAGVKTAVSNHNANCSACHTIHTDADIIAAHTGNALPTTPWACAKCHSNILSLEHSANAMLKQNGLSGLGCATCHQSSAAKVQAAIHSAATDKSNLKCEACHTGTADGIPAVHTDIASPHLTGIFPIASDADCLNCHTTQAAEFNSSKGAYHVVAGLTSKASGYGLYLTPFNSQSVVGCQGCHGDFNDGKAQVSHILKRPYIYTSNSSQTDMLCYLCHNRSVYGGGGSSGSSSSGFEDLHNIGDHRKNGGLQCSWCHTAVPHATSQAHLIVTTTEPNSSGNVLSKYTHPSSGNYSKSSCTAVSGNKGCDEHSGR